MEPTVTLRAITERNRQEIVDLRVAAEQQDFVDGVSESIAEAAATPHASPWYRAVYAGEVPVGFVMLADDVVPGSEVIPWRCGTGSRPLGRCSTTSMSCYCG